MSSYIVSPQAHVDLFEIASFISQDSESVAIRFLEAAEETFTLLADSPFVGRVVNTSPSSQTEIRVFRVRDFPHILVLYRVNGRQPHISRVVHGARDIEALLTDD